MDFIDSLLLIRPLLMAFCMVVAVCLSLSLFVVGEGNYTRSAQQKGAQKYILYAKASKANNGSGGSVCSSLVPFLLLVMVLEDCKEIG